MAACEKSEDPVTYTVIFEVNGGTAIPQQQVKSGKKAAKPADPTRKGYAFKGWHAYMDFSAVFDFDGAITADTTLYAKWATVSYTVTFESNGGTAIAPLAVAESGKVAKPGDPSREGYALEGWYTDAALTQLFDFDAETISKNTTLYVKWTADVSTTKQTYTVTITYQWKAADHGALPGGGHFTTLFVAVHNDQFSLYKTGEKLGAGMEVLAETGVTSTLSTEVANNDNVLAVVTRSERNPQITFSFEIQVDKQHPYISMATMIAPSPDWFVGLSGMLLYENNAFKDKVSGGMNAYDGGTEEGEGFSLSNAATNPQKSVTLLESMNSVPLDNANKPMATYTIAKKD